MIKFSILLISVIFLDCLIAAPVQPSGNGCRQQCPSTSKGSKLKYQPGQIYEYSFDSNVAISLTGNDPQDIQLQVQGIAHLHGLTSNCQFGLDVRDVTVFGPDKSKKKLDKALKLDEMVQFTMANDRIEPEICANSAESDVSLNIKRAIISLLQVNDAFGEETDVFGKCSTNYATTKNEDGSLVIVKTRDLNACSHRESFATGFITGVFNENSKVKSTPLLNGDYTNEIHVQSQGIIETAQVVEDYTVVPFTNGEAGVKIRVVTSLKLKSQRANGNEQPNVSVPKSIIYEAVDKPIERVYEIVHNSLTTICDTYLQRKNLTGPHIAGQFTETIRLMRYAKKDDLLTLHSKALQKNNPICRKVYLDAIFRVGTAESVNAILSLLDNGQIPEKRLAFLSFNLATGVNKDTIRTYTQLLAKDLPREGFLSLGNIIKKYYQQHPQTAEADLASLFEKLTQKLTNGKGKHDKRDVVVSILKGLRGARGVGGALIDRLIELTDESHSTRVRSAAIQAFASTNGNSKIQAAALNILKNVKLDSELRIEAYLALVEFSTPEIAAAIAELIESEPVYQVGSFITTHLANLQASTDLHRVQARQDFAGIQPTKKFPFDFRKFSFNQELSYQLDAFGLGGSTDTNVIYSQDSFTPRSLRSNLTGEFFGTSFNILELNARQEHFDQVLERYFGPKGYVTTMNKQETLANYVHSLHDKRHKRSLTDETQQFGKEHVNSNGRNFEMDLSIKAFGSELYFLSLGDNLPREAKDFAGSFTKWYRNFLKNSKEAKKYAFDAHSLLLDAELSYPTSSGFPLKIQAQGAGAFHVETVFNFDVDAIKNNPKSTKFAVTLVPSYNIELSGMITIDGYEVSTGVKVTSGIHSATGSQLAFELTNAGRGFDLRIKFPEKKQEVFTFDHKIVFIEQNLGHESVSHNLKLTQKKDTIVQNDCFDQLNNYLGVTVCYGLSHNPFLKGEKVLNSRLFPLNGPAHVSAYIEIDQEYQLKSTFTPAAHSFDWDVIFDTPGSTIDRKMALKLTGNDQASHKYLRAAFESQHRKANAEIGLRNSDKEVVAYAEYAGSQEQNAPKFTAKAGFTKIVKSDKSVELTPVVEYNNADVIPYKVSGKILLDGDSNERKITFDKLSVEPTAANSKFGPAKLDGYVEYAFKQDKAFSLSTVLDGSYNGKGGKVSGKFATKKHEFDLDANILSDCEYANGKLVYHHKHDDVEKIKKLPDFNYQYKDDIVLVYGKDFESTTKRIELLHEWEYEREKKTFKKLNTKNKVNIAPMSVKAEANGDVTLNHAGYTFAVHQAANSFGSTLAKDSNQKVAGDWNLKFDAHANKHKVEVSSARVIDEAAKSSTVNVHGKSSFGTDVDFNAKFDNEITNQKAHIDIDTTIVLMKGYKPIKAEFDFSAVGKAGETKGKILYGTTEYVTFNGKLARASADTANGKFEASVHEFLTAHVNFNMLKEELKSDLVLNFIKFNRKVKVDTTYSRTASKLDFHNDFYYDFEKDDTRYIGIDTKNKYSAQKINSVTEVNVNGEKFHLTIDGDRSGQYSNGKQTGQFTLRLPTQRELSGAFTRDVNLSGPKSTGHGTIKLTDTIASTKQSRSVEFEGHLKEGNREKGFFDLLYKLTLVNFDGKRLEANSQLKHLPKNQFKSALVTFNAAGSIPQPISFSVSLDEYCAIHAIYHATAKYGDRANVEFSGNYAVGEADKEPAKFKLNGKVSVPQTKLNDLSFDTSGSLKYPDVQNTNGVYEYDFKFNSKLSDKDIAVETNGKASKQSGDVSVNLKFPETEPFDLSVGYTFDHQPEQKAYKATGNVEVHYGNGKTITVSGDVSSKEHKTRTIHFSAVTPYEKAKNLDFTFKVNKKEENAYDTEVEVAVDGSKYKLINAVVFSRVNPSIHIDLYYPNDGHSQLYAAVNRIGDRKFKLSLRFENINGFNLVSDAELTYQSLENFAVIIDLDSAALKANKLHLDVHTKQSGNNRGIEFSATKENKNILSGSADYQIKEEKGKTTIDGKGNVHLYEKSETISFQLIRNTFDGTQNNETGILLVLNGQIGAKNIDAELKVTNKEFHIRNIICDTKPCINFSINSSFKDVDLKHFTHNLLVTVDLRSLGLTHEFSLKADTKRDGFRVYHTLDTQITSNDQKIYKYNVYVNPSSAGVVLSLPSRTSAVEATFKYPNGLAGQYQADIICYLDKKNHPSKHSKIGFDGEIAQTGQFAFTSKGSLTASHPSVKELRVVADGVLDGSNQVISGNVLFDVFKQTNQALKVSALFTNTDKSMRGFNVTTSFDLKIDDLHLHYKLYENAALSVARGELDFTSEYVGPTDKERFGFYLHGCRKGATLSLVSFDEEYLKSSTKVNHEKKSLEWETKAKILDIQPIESKTIVSFSGASAYVKYGDFFDINAEAIPSKALSFKAVGNKKQLVDIKVALDQANLFSTDYNVDEKGFKEFLKSARDRLKEDGGKGRAAYEERLTQAKQKLTTKINQIKENLPDFSRLNADYKEEYEKFANELMADKSIKELVEFYKKTFELLNKTIGELLRAVINLYQSITKTLNDLFKQLYDAYNTRILPSLKDAYKEIVDALTKLYDELITSALEVLNRVVESLKKFEDDFKKIGKTVSEWFGQVSKVVNEAVVSIQKELADFRKLAAEYIRTLPGLEMLKEKFDEIFKNLIVPDHIIATLKELIEPLKAAFQLKEFSDLVDTTFNYIEKKVQNKQVNDIDELKMISEKLWLVVRSLIKTANSYLGSYGVDTSEQYLGIPLPALGKLSFVPQLSTLKFSVFNYLLREPLPSLTNILQTYRPTAFNPLYSVAPFPIEGRLVNGEYLFTFTGDQITVDGDCQYVLAKDMIDGNFTLVGKISGKKLESISLSDKSGQSVEISATGKIMHNDKAAEFPVQEQTLHAWRKYYTIGIHSTYGVYVDCSLDLSICQVFINGFYHGKLRGLLGKSSYEPYETQTLPDGMIASSATDFLNAYRLQGSCAAGSVAPKTTSQASSSECKALFGFGSTLKLCSVLMDATKYIEACEQAVETAGANKQEAACKIGQAFAYICHSQNIVATIPLQCEAVKCSQQTSTGAKTYSLGERFDEISDKNADIILLADTAIPANSLTHLVQNLITDLRSTLSGYNTQISVIGYKSGDQYLKHFTNDGKLDITNFQLAGNDEYMPKEPKLVKVGCETLDPIFESLYNASRIIREDLSLTAGGAAFREALSYPFRGSTRKVIVAIRSDILEHSKSPLKLLGARLTNEIAKKLGVDIHLIAPQPNLVFDNQKDAKNVVGFNDKSVVYMPGQKARAEDRQHLQYGLDLGIDMVQSGGGYAFNLDRFLNVDEANQQKFVKAVATNIATQIKQYNSGMNCVCSLFKGLYPRVNCLETNKVSKSRKK